MGDDGGVIEQFFSRLIAGDWYGLRALLAPEMERIGPWGDRIVGRDRCIEMMTSIPSGPSNVPDVHRIAYTPDRRSGFARSTAHPALGPVSEIEQILEFVMDDQGLVSLIGVFWQTPDSAPPISD